jgi:hypothetical protein
VSADPAPRQAFRACCYALEWIAALAEAERRTRTEFAVRKRARPGVRRTQASHLDTSARAEVRQGVLTLAGDLWTVLANDCSRTEITVSEAARDKSDLKKSQRQGQGS